MKKITFSCAFALVAVLLVPSCNKSVDGSNSRPQVTIQATVPGEGSRIALTDNGDGLHLAWEAGDGLRVLSGSQSEVFAIKEGFTDHKASFTGAEVTGDSFDIMYPATFASVEEAEASDFSYQVQNGNGSTAHLRYAALLSGVDDYMDIAFTQEWAADHGGTLKRSGAIKLALTLPEGASAIDSVHVNLDGRLLTLALKNVDVSQDGQLLTAYLMTPWNDLALAAGAQVEVTASAPDHTLYGIRFTLAADATLRAGRVSIFNVPNGISEYPYAGGSGTEEDPWLIGNPVQLKNMMDFYASADAPADKTSFKYWYRLIDDVDASGFAWTPLNATGQFYKAIDFDGDGHTLYGLHSGGTYASFVGVLYGSIRNVTFDGAAIDANTKKGVVAGFLGTTGLPGSCENVTVRNSTVSGGSYSGGFAGHVRTTGSVVNCRVENSTVNTSSGYIGGFAAYVDVTGDDRYDVPARFTNCHVANVAVNQNYATAVELYTGGFIGGAGSAAAFTDCSVLATVTATKAAIKDVGGFIGRCTYAGSNFNRCEVLEGSSVSAIGDHVGGFVGYSETAASFTDCSSSASVANSAQYTGGFVGYASGASGFTRCLASGDVTVTNNVNLGGFAGFAIESAFTDCTYRNGTVSSTKSGQSYAGGFCGYPISEVAFRGCKVSGATVTVNAGQRNGGFAGQIGNNSNKGKNNIVVSQCAVLGTSVTSALNSGLFVGVQYGNIECSYVSGGSMNARGNQCSGFSGFIDTGNLTNCYTTATVVGGSYASIGGMIGIQNLCNASYCYSACEISGSGSGVGAFVGKSATATAACSNCIGWHATLPFSGLNTVGAPLTNCYAGAEGTVSAQAVSLAWPASVWDLSASMPVLLDTPRRINAVFVGDSITWQWTRNANTFSEDKLLIPFNSAYMTKDNGNVTVKFHPGFFARNGYLDKGISGQNTSQMLERFQKDVVDLNPAVVVIMGGTNDLAQGVSKEQIVANIAAMSEMAQAAGIKVVLCTVTPCNDSYSRLSNPKTKGQHIIWLNEMLKDYADAQGFAWCDYWSALVADDGLALHPNYRLYDNLHPGPDGYDVMEPIIKPIIDSLF